MEFYDRVRVNYFFVPWIAGILLMLGLPSDIAPDKVQPIPWCIFMAPIVVLELKIYDSEIEFIPRYDAEDFSDLVDMRISYDYNIGGYNEICGGS
ncbi:hypothetical protein SUGI_0079430 [Cryptomeria japonica]|nr:hypothetical protein SUGI_0079430 [Cryptomeria japonica]